MLDQPLKQGREARYSYRHLLQMLLVRRLLAEGYAASAINQLATLKTTLNWKHLQGGVHLTVTPANPALAFLQQIQQRQGELPNPPDRYSKKSTPVPRSLSPTPSQSPALARWTRLEVSLGWNCMSEDFTYPVAPQEQQNLLQYVNQTLAVSMN